MEGSPTVQTAVDCGETAPGDVREETTARRPLEESWATREATQHC